MDENNKHIDEEILSKEVDKEELKQVSGGRCGDNDACYSVAVSYQGMTDCSKAWK